MEEVKVWKEVQQQQQLSTNEVPGSRYKPLPTDIAGGRPRCADVCVRSWACISVCVCVCVCVCVGK